MHEIIYTKQIHAKNNKKKNTDHNQNQSTEWSNRENEISNFYLRVQQNTKFLGNNKSATHNN